ncbi:selenophosphate synthase [Caldisphaera lagunensis DSM 15908]|uniref:Selenophosphate synthase n=1 Tax=Caldisphaera lagunensis (strain DSM 15908 / JCM 11604 / ANMR 0165 / IC-154) TaxID=1056495 RepID=L0A9G6_CALLD|nr:SelD-related putative sulfur metabolism protein [Caldisphaera lagunensis]AFZ70538.1 selenophosphate synthase [Caldisphaera lagunensis DSM 15908]
MNSRRDVLLNNIRQRLSYYRNLGADPLSLATGCAVKVDLLKVVYPAMEKIRPYLLSKNLRIAEREDADIFYADPESVEIKRKVLPLGENVDIDYKFDKEIRAIILIQVYQLSANEPEKFIKKVLPAYESICNCAPLINLGKGHSIVTPFREDEFMLADLISYDKGDKLVAANNDTMHIIDPTSLPSDYRQVSGSLSNSLNDLFVVGAYNNLKIAPVLNAPSDELREELYKNAKRFANEVGAKLLDIEQPKRGRLLLGATVLSSSNKKPPTFHDKADKGMKIITTRPLGELSPITTYLSTAIDESIIDELENKGIDIDQLEKIKEKAVNIISSPNKAMAEVIAKYLPDLNEEFSKEKHIVSATDVTGPGILVVWEQSKLTNTHIKLFDFPLLFPEISEFATENFLMPNATAGTNGGFIIIAPEEIHEDLIKDLKYKGYDPYIIGEIVEKGKQQVDAPKKIKKYILDQEIIDKFNLY